MEARAIAKTVRISAAKARLVIDLVRGKKVEVGIAILKNMNQKAARLIEKVLLSATANAENNLGLKRETLIIKEALIDEGATLKRIHFGSRSHIDRHDRRTSHITIVVASEK